MTSLREFLKEWDLEIIWTVLLAAICLIGSVLATQEDAAAGMVSPPQNAERLPPPADSPSADSATALLPGYQSAHAAAGISPEIRAKDFPADLDQPGVVGRHGFWLFLGSILFGCLCAIFTLVPRCLSPQAKRVRACGLWSAKQESHLEITVVCCDLRGFTPYALAHSSARVLQVLREYYDAASLAVAEHGGTIKDFAGDGVLVLVGAPLPDPQHARNGLELARKIRSAVREVTVRASSPANKLGIGVGVASGYTTVGVIGAASRLEYAAVGPAVNLASRLCQLAADGEILVAAETVICCGARDANSALRARSPVTVKGYSEPVPLFTLQDGAALAI